MEKDFVIVPSGFHDDERPRIKSFSVFSVIQRLFQRQYWNHADLHAGNYFIGWRKNCHLTEELATSIPAMGLKFIKMPPL